MVSKDDELTSEVNKEAEKLAEEIIKDLQLSNVRLKPIVLLLGGFQGSGKTTVINKLKDDLGLVVVSEDEIRQRLLDKKYSFSEKFRQIVKATSSKILKNIFKMGYSVALDVNATPARIKKVEKLLESEDLSNYCLITAYLQTSKEGLVRRLNLREDVRERYKGTANELEASIRKYGEIDKSVYDVVINTEKLDAQAAAEVIRNRVKSFRVS